MLEFECSWKVKHVAGSGQSPTRGGEAAAQNTHNHEFLLSSPEVDSMSSDPGALSPPLCLCSSLYTSLPEFTSASFGISC